MSRVAATAARGTETLGYRPAIDGVRAVSVLAVLLYHAGAWWMSGGFLGVEVFFVVSGFLITTLLLEERRADGSVDLRSFWIRRARRLLPALFVLLLVVPVVALLFHRDAAGRLGGDVLAALAYVSNWWQILGGDSYFVDAGRPPLLRHLWSLAVEEQFYVVFPPLFAVALGRLGARRMRQVLIALALGSALLMAVLFEPFTDTSRIYYGTDTRLAGLLAGAVLAMSWTPWRSRSAAAARAGRVLDGVGVAALVVLAWFFVRVNAFDPFVYRGGFLLLDVVCVVLLAVLVHPAARLSRLLSWRPLVWVGLRSYALYLWHWPIFQITRPGLDLPVEGLPVFVLRVAATFGAAELSYRYVERPLRSGALGAWWNRFRGSTGRRRAAMTRGAVLFGGVGALVVVALAAGLVASATDPGRGRQEVLAAGLAAEPDSATADVEGSASESVEDDPTTTSAPGTSVSTAGGDASAAPPDGPDGTAPPQDTSTTVPTSAAPPPSTTLAADRGPGAGLLAVGDSVMAGAQSALLAAMPGARVDAQVGRQFDDVLGAVRWYTAEGLAPGPVVVHLGNNGAFGDADLDRLVDAAGGRRILLVNAKVARPWQDLVNQRIAAGAGRHPNAVLVDWHAAASAHPEWFAADGAHLRPEGARAFATMVRDHL